MISVLIKGLFFFLLIDDKIDPTKLHSQNEVSFHLQQRPAEIASKLTPLAFGELQRLQAGFREIPKHVSMGAVLQIYTENWAPACISTWCCRIVMAKIASQHESDIVIQK